MVSAKNKNFGEKKKKKKMVEVSSATETASVLKI